ncbi:MAG TPA: hypothetical protein VGL22_19120 [Terracidiphilus sp.]|jgi:hypothetical protein
MESNTNICAGMETRLADLLLDPETVPVAVKTHVSECDGCSRELEELRATMAVMDAWEAPEPNPYFMTRFQARLREERQAQPAGWLERFRARLMMRPQKVHTRPLVAMAMTVLLLVGGGAYLDFYWQAPPAVPHETAVVHDLQTLDSNAQVLDQLESMDDDSGDAVQQ